MKKSKVEKVFYVYPVGGTVTNNAIFENFNLYGLKYGENITYQGEKLFVWLLTKTQLETLINSARANDFQFSVFEKVGDSRYRKMNISGKTSSESLKAVQAVIRAELDRKGNGSRIQRELRNTRNRKVKVVSGSTFHYDRVKKKLRIFDASNNLVTYEGAESVRIRMPETEAEMMTFLIELLSAFINKKIKMKAFFENMIFRIE